MSLSDRLPGDAPGRQGWKAPAADVLTSVMSTLRLRGTVFCRAELRAPWGMAIPAGDLAHFHLVEQGGCCLRLHGAGPDGPLSLLPGDLVIVPHGAGHLLGDAPETPTVPLAQLVGGARQEAGPHRIRHGGKGPATLLVCGGFRFEPHLRSGAGPGSPLLGLLPPLLHIPGEGGRPAPGVDAVVHLLAAETREPRPGTETIVSRLAEVLFVEALRTWMERLAVGEGGWLGALRDRRIGAALGHLHRAPGHAWTVAALAAAVGMSRSPFAARFAALVGEPPLAYLTRWRMHTAADLLREQDLSLAQVAERVGYESEPAFSKAFKRQFGVPPGAWRRGRQAA